MPASSGERKDPAVVRRRRLDRTVRPRFGGSPAVRSSPVNDEIIARTRAKRWGKSDEIIGATVFLASRASGRSGSLFTVQAESRSREAIPWRVMSRQLHAPV